MRETPRAPNIIHSVQIEKRCDLQYLPKVQQLVGGLTAGEADWGNSSHVWEKNPKTDSLWGSSWEWVWGRIR